MLNQTGVPIEAFSEPSMKDPERPTLVCFSHLRWDFVFQRPQHLLSRFANDMNVIVWEEPIVVGKGEAPFVKVRRANGFPAVRVVVPHLPEGLTMIGAEKVLTRLFETFASSIRGPVIAWYYTPMMLPFSRGVDADVVVYDAMDELSKFRFAPPILLDLERELLAKADLVFTGGSSLYEAKKDRHPSVHLFPSSVDRDHFGQARTAIPDPADQAELSHPRFGFYGVIDERFDIDLLDQIASMRPDWSFVMVGPVVKVAPEDLPKQANIHYLGAKTYDELPAYLSGWDVALMPFAMNESTEFISPTKTPEYLAGGTPVVSTPVKDVVRHYGHLEGVQIAGDAESFVAACEKALELSKDRGGQWRAEADLLLSATSWKTTQARMAGLIDQVLGARAGQHRPAMLVAAE